MGTAKESDGPATRLIVGAPQVLGGGLDRSPAFDRQLTAVGSLRRSRCRASSVIHRSCCRGQRDVDAGATERPLRGEEAREHPVGCAEVDTTQVCSAPGGRACRRSAFSESLTVTANKWLHVVASLFVSLHVRACSSRPRSKGRPSWTRASRCAESRAVAATASSYRLIF